MRRLHLGGGRVPGTLPGRGTDPAGRTPGRRGHGRPGGPRPRGRRAGRSWVRRARTGHRWRSCPSLGGHELREPHATAEVGLALALGRGRAVRRERPRTFNRSVTFRSGTSSYTYTGAG